MIITMIGTLPPLKGMSDYCLELVNSMLKYGIKIDFISFKQIYPEFLYPGGTRDTDKKFVKPNHPNLNVRDILTYYNPLTWLWAGISAKGKIVHIQWWTTVLSPIIFIIMLILKIRSKIIVMTVHNVYGHETNIIDKIITKVIFFFPNVFILHSNRNIDTMKNRFNIDYKKCVRIPHGIYDFYKDEEITKENARKHLGIPMDKKVILCFGNIRSYKGIDIMLEAFVLVKDKIPNALLVIAGKNWIDWKPYEKFIKDNALEDSVITYLNFVPMSEVKYYFEAADIVALPYKEFEAQSGPGNIALAFSKPLIVSDVGGLPDLVKDKRGLVPPNDSISLANNLIYLLSHNKVLKKLSDDSKLIAQDYQWDNIAKKTINLYKKLVKGFS